MPVYSFWGSFILLDVLCTSEISGLVSDINLEKFLVTVSNIYCSFLSSFWFPIKHILQLLWLSLCPCIFCSVFLVLALLDFSVLEVSIEISSSSEILSLAMSSLLTSPSNILHFRTVHAMSLLCFFFLLVCLVAFPDSQA